VHDVNGRRARQGDSGTSAEDSSNQNRRFAELNSLLKQQDAVACVVEDCLKALRLLPESRVGAHRQEPLRLWLLPN